MVRRMGRIVRESISTPSLEERKTVRESISTPSLEERKTTFAPVLTHYDATTTETVTTSSSSSTHPDKPKPEPDEEKETDRRRTLLDLVLGPVTFKSVDSMEILHSHNPELYTPTKDSEITTLDPEVSEELGNRLSEILGLQRKKEAKIKHPQITEKPQDSRESYIYSLDHLSENSSLPSSSDIESGFDDRPSPSSSQDKQDLDFKLSTFPREDKVDRSYYILSGQIYVQER